MEICKKLNEVLAELKEIGVYSFSVHSVTGVTAQMRIEDLKNLNLEVSVKMRERDMKYPYEVYSVADGVEFFAIVSKSELMWHFPHLAKGVIL